MTGPTDLVTLVNHYESTSGINCPSVQWPQSEAEMLSLQHKDSDLKIIFTMLEKDHTIPVHYGNRNYFQALLKDGRRGALRAQHANIDLGTMYAWMQHNITITQHRRKRRPNQAFAAEADCSKTNCRSTAPSQKTTSHIPAKLEQQ